MGFQSGSRDTSRRRFLTVEIRIPVTDNPNDPLHLVVGRKPTTSLPWHFNVCRQRTRENGVEYSAFSPTGASGFHHPLRFAHLHAGRSHQFASDPSVTSYISVAKAAAKLPKQEAMAEFVALANGRNWRDLPQGIPTGKIVASPEGTLISIDRRRFNILRSNDA